MGRTVLDYVRPLDTGRSGVGGGEKREGRGEKGEGWWVLSYLVRLLTLTTATFSLLGFLFFVVSPSPRQG